MKRKQFSKGVNQIAQEGAIRIFFEPNSGFERVYVGVVGQLQFDVLESRMKNEYGVEYRQFAQSYTLIKRVPDGIDPSKLYLYEVKWVQDVRGKNYLLFNSEWNIRYTLEHNEGLELEEYVS